MKLPRYLVLQCIFLLVACKSNPDRSIIPGWSTDLLGPLVKTKVTGEQILQLQDLSVFSFSTVYDFGFGNPGQPDSIPDINLPDLVKTDSISSQFVSMELEKGSMFFKVSNTLDIDVKKGAVISILQQGVTLLSDTLRTDLAAHTGIFLSRTVSLAGKTLYPQVEVSIKNLGTHGTYGKPLQPGDKKLVANFFLQNISFKSLTLHPGSYTISDTSSFNLNGRTIKTDAISGDIFAYVKNRFPFTSDLQFYFMDANYLVKDSMFASHVIIAPSTISDTETVFRQPITEAKVSAIKEAAFVNSAVTFYSAQDVTIQKQNFIELQLVGDLKLRVNQ